MNTLSISNTHIRQDNQGRYCLNDLHKAAGDNSKHQPANFLRLATTKELVEEISHCSDVRSHSSEMRTAVEVVNGGKAPGTYVAKEIVYAYAMWISPKFSLQVIRAYDALATQPDPDDELTSYYLHPDGQYRLERPALAQGYAIPDPLTQLATVQAKYIALLERQVCETSQTHTLGVPRPWTPEDKATAWELKAQRLGCTRIGLKMNRTAGSVRDFFRREQARSGGEK